MIASGRVPTAPISVNERAMFRIEAPMINVLNCCTEQPNRFLIRYVKNDVDFIYRILPFQLRCITKSLIRNVIMRWLLKQHTIMSVIDGQYTYYFPSGTYIIILQEKGKQFTVYVK